MRRRSESQMKSRSQDEVRVRRQGSPSLPWSGVLPRAAAGLGQLRDVSLNSVLGPDSSLEGDKGQDGGLPARHLSGTLKVGVIVASRESPSHEALHQHWANRIFVAKGPGSRKGVLDRDTQ